MGAQGREAVRSETSEVLIGLSNSPLLGGWARVLVSWEQGALVCGTHSGWWDGCRWWEKGGESLLRSNKAAWLRPCSDQL